MFTVLISQGDERYVSGSLRHHHGRLLVSRSFDSTREALGVLAPGAVHPGDWPAMPDVPPSGTEGGNR